jgi:hypothetical protein
MRQKNSRTLTLALAAALNESGCAGAAVRGVQECTTRSGTGDWRRRAGGVGQAESIGRLAACSSARLGLVQAAGRLGQAL